MSVDCVCTAPRHKSLEDILSLKCEFECVMRWIWRPSSSLESPFKFMSYFCVVCRYFVVLIPIIHSSKSYLVQSFGFDGLIYFSKFEYIILDFHANIWISRLMYIFFYVVFELWQNHMMSKIALPWSFNQVMNGK